MSIKKAIVAGGCFWGLEDLIRREPGVVDTEVGYTGGTNNHPTYEHHPGHAEAVAITYDTEITSYKKLLDFFFRVHNPTTKNRQGNDVGSSYRSAIFYSTPEEKRIAQEMIALVNASKRWDHPVVTTLEQLTTFWPAEKEHQDYLKRNPGGYTCHALYGPTYLS